MTFLKHGYKAQALTVRARLRAQVIRAPVEADVELGAAPSIGLQAVTRCHLRLSASAGIHYTGRDIRYWIFNRMALKCIGYVNIFTRVMGVIFYSKKVDVKKKMGLGRWETEE